MPIGVQLFLMSDHLFIYVPLSLLVGAVITLTIITALAALYPSMRAARLRPIEAMAHFG